MALYLLSAAFSLAQVGSADWQDAQSALKRGEYAQAEESFRRFLSKSPAVAEGHVNLGLSLHLQKKNTEAIAAFRRAIELQPRLAHAYLFLGIDLFNLNNTAEALVELQRYVKLAPSDPQGHYYTGLSFAARGETNKAIQAFETAAGLAPRNVDILYHLAQAYITAANSIAQRAAEHDPKLTLLREWERQHSGLSELIRQSPARDDDKAVLKSLQARLDRNPIDLEAEQRAAAAYANLYLQTTQRFVEIEPDSFRIHQLLAAYYEKTGNTEKAIQELQQVLSKKVHVRGVHFALGSIYKDNHQPELALKHFQQELQISSPEPETPVQIAQVLLSLQRNAEALQELDRARQSTGENSASYWRTLGKVYTAMDRYPDAVKSYEKALAIGPSDRTLLYQLGQAYRRVGKIDLARKMLAASNEAAQAQLSRERERTEAILKDREKSKSKAP